MALLFLASYSRTTIFKPRINNQIQAKEVRVVDEEGRNLGVFSLSEALKLAQERDLDLIETAPNATPPVAKIMSYGKYRYEGEKAQRKQRAKERKDTVKTVQISVRAQLHDLAIQAKKSSEFLEEGHRVQVILRLRGREKAHPNIAYEKLQQFLKIIPIEIKVVQERKTPQGFQALITK